MDWCDDVIAHDTNMDTWWWCKLRFFLPSLLHWWGKGQVKSCARLINKSFCFASLSSLKTALILAVPWIGLLTHCPLGSTWLIPWLLVDLLALGEGSTYSIGWPDCGSWWWLQVELPSATPWHSPTWFPRMGSWLSSSSRSATQVCLLFPPNALCIFPWDMRTLLYEDRQSLFQCPDFPQL